MCLYSFKEIYSYLKIKSKEIKKMPATLIVRLHTFDRTLFPLAIDLESFVFVSGTKLTERHINAQISAPGPTEFSWDSQSLRPGGRQWGIVSDLIGKALNDAWRGSFARCTRSTTRFARSTSVRETTPGRVFGNSVVLCVLTYLT